MRIKRLPESERPVEKAIGAGVKALSNAELIAVILGTGTADKSAVEVAGEVSLIGLQELAECTAEELTCIPGIGPKKAVRILASIEFGRRVLTAPKEQRARITSADEAANLLLADMRYLEKEYFKILILNSRGDVTFTETVSVGELNSAPVHPREVFRPAIRRSAAAIILVHNHPAGDPAPSREDIETTKRLVECGRLVGISVLDHIIIGDGRYESMQALGYM